MPVKACLVSGEKLFFVCGENGDGHGADAVVGGDGLGRSAFGVGDGHAFVAGGDLGDRAFVMDHVGGQGAAKP